MIQLQYSTSGTTNKAAWLETKFTGSQVQIQLTSSFTGDVTNITSDIISNKTTPYGGWILVEINKNKIPTNSGQYFANIYIAELGGAPTWIEATSQWKNEDETWINYAGDIAIGDLLSEDRALVSGSDYDTTYKYQYLEESNFTVYNG